MNFDILSYSLVQGISEILPVSSSANLYLFSKLLSAPEFLFSMKVALHAGSLITLLIYFREEITDIFRGIFGKKELSETYLLQLIVATIPVVIFGYFSRDFVKEFDSPRVMGLCCIIFGLALVLFDKLSSKARPSKKPIALIKSLLIGVFQAISVIPGISRLGICITASRILGIDRKNSIHFSLLLAVPSICGSLTLEILECFKKSDFGVFTEKSMIGIGLTALIGLIAIFPCIRYMERKGFAALAIYRVIIGLVIYFI